VNKEKLLFPVDAGVEVSLISSSSLGLVFTNSHYSTW